ncbi:hypothetical protein ABE485_09825 [Achromobacter spanius]|uniref:hypothetical protein n=1 Tax=Achromobacter spanius TaxID=217203 RepID=UPI000FADD8C1
MRTLTIAGLMLAFLLGGCAQTGISGADRQHSGGPTRSDPANYHQSSFGEPDNEPFQGVYPGR